MYKEHASALPFKDNCLHIQVWTNAPTFANNFNQFFSNQRSFLNYTQIVQMGLLIQLQDHRKATPFQAINCKTYTVNLGLHDLLILFKHFLHYLNIAAAQQENGYVTGVCSNSTRETNSVQDQTACFALQPAQKRLQCEKHKGWATADNPNEPTMTMQKHSTASHSQHWGEIQLADPLVVVWFESSSLQVSNLIKTDQCGFITIFILPLESCGSDACCSEFFGPSQHKSALASTESQQVTTNTLSGS